MKFAGKVALVTGAASGIGLAVATGLAQGGATVYLGDINEDNGRAAAAELGDGATFVRLDVTNADSIAAGWSKV